MMIHRLLRAVTLVVTLAVAVAPLAGNELRTGVENFLATGATASAANYSQAAAEYRQLRAQAPQDDRVTYACAIVLLNQRKYANALPLLAKQVARNPADVEAACWHVWALVQCRRYAEALTALEQLGSRLADPAAAAESGRQPALHMLGRLLGYFERVRPGNVSAEDVLRVKNGLLARLSKADLEVLDEGTAETAARFAELEAARQQRLAARAESSEAARETVAQSIALQNSQAAHGEAERDAKASESTEAVRQWTLLRTQIASLTQDRARVSAQMLTVQAMLQELNRTFDVGTVGTGSVAQDFSRQVVSIEDVARAQQLSMQLAVLNKQAFDMDRKLLEYGQKAQSLRVVGAAQGEAAIRNEELRQDAVKRAAQLDKRLRQLEREKPAQAATMTAQMRNLATYVPFDYEAERARVLAWFD